jgi:hypothetical protein
MGWRVGGGERRRIWRWNRRRTQGRGRRPRKERGVQTQPAGEQQGHRDGIWWGVMGQGRRRVPRVVGAMAGWVVTLIISTLWLVWVWGTEHGEGAEAVPPAGGGLHTVAVSSPRVARNKTHKYAVCCNNGRHHTQRNLMHPFSSASLIRMHSWEDAEERSRAARTARRMVRKLEQRVEEMRWKEGRRGGEEEEGQGKESGGEEGRQVGGGRRKDGSRSKDINRKVKQTTKSEKRKTAVAVTAAGVVVDWVTWIGVGEVARLLTARGMGRTHVEAVLSDTYGEDLGAWGGKYWPARTNRGQYNRPCTATGQSVDWGDIWSLANEEWLTGTSITGWLRWALPLEWQHRVFDPRWVEYQDGKLEAGMRLAAGPLLDPFYGAYHVSNNHWWALLIHPRSREVVVFDSMQGGRLQVPLNDRRRLTATLSIIWEGEWSWRYGRCPQQTDGYNCGIFALMAVWRCAHQLPVQWDTTLWPAIRVAVALDLLLGADGEGGGAVVAPMVNTERRWCRWRLHRTQQPAFVERRYSAVELQLTRDAEQEEGGGRDSAGPR